MCVYEKKTRSQRTNKKIEPHVFFLISPHRQTPFVFTHIRTKRHTKKKKKKKAAGCLARPTNKKKKRCREKKRNEDRPNGDNNNNGNQGQKKKRESNGHAHTHTHTHASTSSKWHSRRSEKGKERERVTDKKTAHKRETWWLNNEQKIHTNFLIQARRLRETRSKKVGKARENKTNKQLISCFIS
jgi:hypothetical protein